MKLVLVAIEWINGWSKGPHAIPIEYKSKDALVKRIMRLSKKHFGDIYANVDNSNRLFELCGCMLDSHDYYCKFSDGQIWKMPVPLVYTLDEWYKKHHKK